MNELNSIRQLATAVQKSHTAVRGWVKREDWPWARKPPWNADDAPAMLAWAGRTLAPDPNADAARPVSGFWSMHEHHVIPDLPKNESDPLAMPPLICTPIDREILTGKRTLKPADARELVGYVVRFRAILVEVCESLPRALTGHAGDEIQRRLWADVHDRIGWLNDRLQDIADAQDGVERDDAGNIHRAEKPKRASRIRK